MINININLKAHRLKRIRMRWRLSSEIPFSQTWPRRATAECIGKAWVNSRKTFTSPTGTVKLGIKMFLQNRRLIPIRGIIYIPLVYYHTLLYDV